MATLTDFVDPDTGWSFKYETESGGKPPRGGMVLRQVRHGVYNLAKEVRLVGIWLEMQTEEIGGKIVPMPPKFFVLQEPAFDFSTITILKPQAVRNPITGQVFRTLQDSDAALSFKDHFDDGSNSIGCGLKALYKAPTLLSAETNCEFAGLNVEQIYLFCRYATVPKHEPSGGLPAARFHPLARFSLLPNPAYDPGKRTIKIVSIRFDYRIHYYVDPSIFVATNAKKKLGNQAGLFADSDSVVATGAAAAASFVWNFFDLRTWETAYSRGAFDSVEKPLLLEVVAPGLAKGFPWFFLPEAKGGTVLVKCWDNVHWWGARGPNAPLISAPGAFHCAHLHWRWGAAAAGAPDTSGNQKFNPIVYPAGIGKAAGSGWGPIVDPRIWIQSISVAIVQDHARLNPAAGAPLESLSTPEWQTLFDANARTSPEAIENGADIVFWYSAVVHRQTTLLTFDKSVVGKPQTFTTVMAGTIFLHGIFFAHDAEKSALTVGSRDPAHRPNDRATILKQRRWLRPAN